MPAGTPSVTSLDAGARIPLTRLGGRTPPIDYAVSYAFGLRLLVVGYVGPLIRLRRASDDAESDFFSIRGFLDTASIAAWLGVSDGFCRTKYDQSGNGRDEVQALADKQPKYAASHNGRPGLLWDGVDDSLKNTDLDLAQPYEVSFVWQSESVGAFNFLDSTDAFKRGAVFSPVGTGKLGIYAGGTGRASAARVTDLDTHYTGVQFDGVSSVARHDGVVVITGLDPGSENQNGLTIGSDYIGGFNLDGHIYELIVSAGGLLSGAQRSALEADQAAFYGVP